jgi:hypothetical protein
MTVEQHEAAARGEMKRAKAEEAASYTDAPGATDLNASNDPELYLYPQSGNLVQSPLEDAQLLEQRARQHEQAAADLTRSEDAQCTAVPAAERSTCPFLGSITQVTDIEGGARIEPKDPARVASLLPRMLCHLAYARAHGFSSAPECALYIRGVDFHATPDGRAIDIVASPPKTMAQTAAEIRRRVRASTVQ